MVQLRDYQQAASNAALNYIHSNNNKPGMIIMPTGSGKSWVIADIADKYSGKILVLQPSVDLLDQNYEKFTSMGGQASIYSTSRNSKEIGHITYATLGSIKSKGAELRKLGVSTVLIDECHDKYSPDASSMFMKFVAEMKPKKVVGLTATPFRLKTNSLGSRLVMLNRMRPGIFRHVLHITQISEMIDRGYWTPSIDEAWRMDDGVLKLNTTGAEYTQESIKRYAEVNGINNKIYKRILQAVSEGRKSILAFVDSKESCNTFVKFIRDKHDINVEALTSDTKRKDRKRILEEFKSGKIQILFNYNILSTGFDHPELDCIIMGRPTNSLVAWYQIYGRGVRKHKNKENFLFIDFGNNFDRLSHPRNLVVENHPGFGWGVFAGEKLVTGVILDGETITKGDIDNELEDTLKEVFFRSGKYQGRKAHVIAQFDPGYLRWIIEKTSYSDTFKEQLKMILKYQNTQQAIPGKVSGQRHF